MNDVTDFVRLLLDYYRTLDPESAHARAIHDTIREFIEDILKENEE